MPKDTPLLRPRRLAQPSTSDAPVLNVAIYPYLPRPQQFEDAITAAWQSVRPQGPAINFVDYDCYTCDPPITLDVFTFDTIFINHFVQAGYLLPVDGQLSSDFFDFAVGAVTVGGQPVAYPQLGCLSSLVVRRGDTPLLLAEGSDGVYDVLGPAADPTVPQPPPGSGLLIDYTGRTTDACEYAQAVQQHTGVYDTAFVPPPSLDQPSIDALLNYTKAAGRAQAGFHDSGSQRQQWFTGGLGRAMAGVTESLSTFPVDQIGNYTVRPKPLAVAAGRGQNGYFVDGVGVSPRSTDLDAAQAMAQVMTSQQVLAQGCVARSSNENPQYLIPARQSTLGYLGTTDRLYNDINQIVSGGPRHAFTVDVTVRDWIAAQAVAIRDQLLQNDVEANDTIHVNDLPIHPALASLPANLARKR
ncbi:MAG: thiamine pyridinylase [Propionibacteriales bacterium]|nr:thiamine pyridinylase [Propionibacteriales bacterium]